LEVENGALREQLEEMRLYAEKMEAQRDEIHSRLHSLQVSNFKS
jgi:hypothetical protein